MVLFNAHILTVGIPRVKVSGKGLVVTNEVANGVEKFENFGKVEMAFEPPRKQPRPFLSSWGEDFRTIRRHYSLHTRRGKL